MVKRLTREGRRRRTAAAPALLAAGLLPWLAGCVERILEVRSDPPGATVYLNGDEIGVTPLDHPFTFYGTAGVTLRRAGHISHRELLLLETPWYQVFPVDLFADLLWPGTIRDVHRLEARLTPSPGPPEAAERNEAAKRLEAMRGLLGPGEAR